MEIFQLIVITISTQPILVQTDKLPIQNTYGRRDEVKDVIDVFAKTMAILNGIQVESHQQLFIEQNNLCLDSITFERRCAARDFC